MNSPKSTEPRSDAPTTTHTRRPRKRIVAAMALLSLAVALAAVGLHWTRESADIRSRAIAELAAVADMKIAQIMHWRDERLGDARFVSGSPGVAEEVRALLANPNAEPARSRMLKQLTLLRGAERYEQITLFRADRSVLLSVSSKRAEGFQPQPDEVATALAAREPLLMDLHRDADGGIHMNVLAPIFPPDAGSAAKPVAAVVFRLNPHRFLYPLIQQWPLPSQSGEVGIARREGDDFVFLTGLRQRPDAALNLREPLDTPNRPMAIAINGNPGVIEGRDYSGRPVVSVIYPVPGSPWFLGVKMDAKEVYEPLREQAMNSGATALALTFAVLGGVVWFWRREENTYLRRELEHEAARHEAETKYRRYIADAPVGIFVLDGQGRFVEVNPAAGEISGYDLHELIGQPFLTVVQAAQQEAGLAHFQRAMGSGKTGGTLGIRHKHGWDVLVEFSAVKLSADRLLGFVSDVTAQRKAEESLQLFRALVDRSSDAIEVIDPETGRFIDVNERGCTDLGYTRPEALALHVWEVDPTLKQAEWPARIPELRSGAMPAFETIHRRKDGSTFPVEVNARMVSLDREYILAAVRDITERRRAEEQLRRLSVVVEQSPATIVITDPKGVIEYVNPRFTELTGYTAEEAVGKNPRILKSEQHPPDYYRHLWSEITAGRTWRGELCNRKRDGELYWEWATIAPILDHRGNITQFVAIKEDITERKRAADALRETQERFTELAENIEEVFWVIDPATSRVFYVSPAFERIWGRTCESVYEDPESWIEAIHPDDREHMAEKMHARIESGTCDETYRIHRPDGAVRWIRDRAFPVRDAAGHIVRIVGVAQDVTESQQLQAQYLQAQKMEAIGQLAGGVAHDFNNILSIMSIHSEMLLDELPEGDPMREAITDIQRATERATALTRQLLVFSRQQVIEPKVLDLNGVVAESEKMLRRLIGEDVRLSTVLAPGLDPVRIDPGQFNQIVMNLAVNARDAMPQGGQLTIETSTVAIDDEYMKSHAGVQPGRYVLLSITDTGTGMTPDVLERIFEPFFTTKGVGRGTGLGLAVVHGIVKQAGGHLGVYSEPGTGTTFKIYLPAIAGEKPADSAMTRAAAARGTETILLVDDEETFRRVTAAALDHLGYTVLGCSSGAQALEMARQHAGTIHLLLTDVVMPGMGGRVLAERLCAQRPSLKVLYQSGYTDDAVVRHGILQAEVAFLQKPFSLAALAAKVRAVLDK